MFLKFIYSILFLINTKKLSSDTLIHGFFFFRCCRLRRPMTSLIRVDYMARMPSIESFLPLSLHFLFSFFPLQYLIQILLTYGCYEWTMSYQEHSGKKIWFLLLNIKQCNYLSHVYETINLYRQLPLSTRNILNYYSWTMFSFRWYVGFPW